MAYNVVPRKLGPVGCSVLQAKFCVGGDTMAQRKGHALSLAGITQEKQGPCIYVVVNPEIAPGAGDLSDTFL